MQRHKRVAKEFSDGGSVRVGIVLAANAVPVPASRQIRKFGHGQSVSIESNHAPLQYTVSCQVHAAAVTSAMTSEGTISTRTAILAQYGH